MASDLPPPPVPTDIDFAKVDGFFLDTTRLLGSELVIVSTGDEFKAAVLLWCHAWKQRPACSLPNDERLLAGFARVAPQRWKKLREVALRGFVLCSDGRLYHRVLAADAVRAWEAVQRQRARTQAATEARKRGRNDHRHDARDVNRNEGVHDGRNDPRDGDRNVHHGTGRDVTKGRVEDESVLDTARGPAQRVAEAFAAQHAEIWPDYGEFRLLRRFPGSLVPEVQAWLDRGASPELLIATLAEGLSTWRRDGEPPKGVKPFERDVAAAIASAKGRATTGTGALTQAEDDRLAYLTCYLAERTRGDWFPEWGAKPRSPDDARAELGRLEAKRDGKAAA